jgi:hypothetical protein
VPTVTGALFFRERLGQYEYHHFPNSHATLIPRSFEVCHEGTEQPGQGDGPDAWRVALAPTRPRSSPMRPGRRCFESGE